MISQLCGGRLCKKTLTRCRDDSSETVPSTSSEPIENNAVVMIVLRQFLPLALSPLEISRLLKKVNKPARNLPVPAKGRDLASNLVFVVVVYARSARTVTSGRTWI